MKMPAGNKRFGASGAKIIGLKPVKSMCYKTQVTIW